MSEFQDMHELTAANLDKVARGLPAAALHKKLAAAVRDCIDRPTVKAVRKVTLEMDLRPVCVFVGDTATCEGVKGTFAVKLKIPAHETSEVDFGVQQNGRLIFSETSPHNHRQGALPFPSDAESDDQTD